MRHRLAIEWTGGADLVLASLVFFGPYATGALSGAPMWNNWITGAIVAVAAMYNMYTAEGGRTERAYWPALVNVAAGLWIVASAPLLGAPVALTAYNLAFGAILLAASFWNAWAAMDARYEMVRTTSRS